MVVPSGGGGAGGVVDGGGGGGVVSAAGSGSGTGTGRVKGSWTPEEDDMLRRAVARHGARNWTVISADIPGRSGKSCRLRWCNQLSPGVERRAFTPDEDAVIVAAHAQHGNRWATIARMLHGRTDNSVKNHWNSTLRRQRRAAAAHANAVGAGGGGGGGGCAAAAALQLRPPIAAAVAGGTAGAPVVQLRHLLDLKEDMEDEEEEEEEDGSSEDSVLMPPPKKRPCAGHQRLSLPVKLEGANPSPPPPAEPVTSLTLSLLPGGGGGVHEATPTATPAASVVEVEGAVKMRAKLEQDPWFVPVMRQMICEEVQRQMQGVNVSCSLLPVSSAGGVNGGGANGSG